MKTQACQLFAYCETSGAPVGICSLKEAKAWRGTHQEQTLYWEVVQNIGQSLLFEFSATQRFFNTETGNFVLFRSIDGAELVLAEIIYVEEEAPIFWRGISFSYTADSRISLKLNGLTCFFDASITLPNTLLPYASLYAIGQPNPWNVAVLDCNYDSAYEVEFKSDTMHIQGICFRREHDYIY